MESAKIKVVGVSGRGHNVVNRIIASGLQGIDFYAINTNFTSSIALCRFELSPNWRTFNSWTRYG